MGRRGPPPEPTPLKLWKGNPGKRPVNTREPVPRRDSPQCPDLARGGGPTNVAVGHGGTPRRAPNNGHHRNAWGNARSKLHGHPPQLTHQRLVM